jgi:hypothetical protein
MTSFPARRAKLGQVAAQLFTVFLGVAAIAWGVDTFPVFWQQSPLEHTAMRAIEGYPFSTDGLIGLMPTVEATERARYCRPAGLRSAAIIRLRLAEEAIAASERNRIDGLLSTLRGSIHGSLDCSPADPFLWVALFWLENNLSGFSQHHLEYLQLSYRLGPNEGWLGLKRNGLALAMFEQLPPNLREMAINEFAGLLESGFYKEVVAIFTGPGWPLRDVLLLRLKAVTDVHRQAFAGELYSEGYDVNVPGVKEINPRHW